MLPLLFTRHLNSVVEACRVIRLHLYIWTHLKCVTKSWKTIIIQRVQWKRTVLIYTPTSHSQCWTPHKRNIVHVHLSALFHIHSIFSTIYSLKAGLNKSLTIISIYLITSGNQQTLNYKVSNSSTYHISCNLLHTKISDTMYIMYM